MFLSQIFGDEKKFSDNKDKIIHKPLHVSQQCNNSVYN